MVPWGVRGLYGAPAIEHKACPPTMGSEPPRAIKHPAVIGLDGLQAPVTVFLDSHSIFNMIDDWDIAYRIISIIPGHAVARPCELD